MKIEVGQKVTGKLGLGTITKIITKSTGYVEVTYDNGTVKKEMAFNLTSENGEVVKNKPVQRVHTAESAARANREYDAFQRKVKFAALSDEYLPSEVARRMRNF